MKLRKEVEDNKGYLFVLVLGVLALIVNIILLFSYQNKWIIIYITLLSCASFYFIITCLIGYLNSREVTYIKIKKGECEQIK